MDHHTTQRLVCLLSLFKITIPANSFDLDLKDNIDLPENIRAYLATFENRILQAVDTEFKRQLTMIRARIDYRIPSLLDLTLTDKIHSGFINKAVEDAMIKRVESLEEEVVLLHIHLEGNMTQLDEVKAKLQESDNKLQSITTKIASASSANTAAVRRLKPEIKTIKSALSTLDSKVNTLISNITTDRENAESVHLKQQDDLDGLQFEVANLNSSIVTIDSGVANLDEDVQNLKSDMELVRNNDSVIASGLDELRTSVQGIDMTLNGTLSDVRENTDVVRSQQTNLLRIGDLCNITSMGLEEMKDDVEVIQSAITEVTAGIQANKEEIFDLNTTLLSVGETSNLTAFDVEELKSGFKTVQSSALDVRGNSEDIRDLKDELTEILEGDNITHQELNEISFKLQRVESAVTQTGVDVADNRRHTRDLETEVILIGGNAANATLDLKVLKVGFEELRITVRSVDKTLNKTLSDDVRSQKANLRRIGDLCNVTSMGLEEMETELATILSAFNETTASIQRNNEEIVDLNTTLLSIKDIGNLTAFSVEELKSGFQAVQSSALDIIRNREIIRDLENELVEIHKGDNITHQELKELTFRFQTIDSAVTQASVDLANNRRDMLDLETEMSQIGENATNANLNLKGLQVGIETLRTTINGTASDVEEINQSLITINEKMTGEVLVLGLLVSNNTGAVKDIERELGVLRENSTMMSLDARNMKTQMLEFGARINKTASSTTDTNHELVITKSELTSVKQNVTKLASKVTENTLEIKNKLNITTASIDETKREVSVVGSRLDSTRSVVTNNTRVIKTFQSELPSIRLKVEKANSDTRVNTNSVSSVQSRLNSLSSQLNKVKSGIANLKRDVKFEVRLANGTKTISKSSTLKFDQVRYNTGSAYSSATGQFRAPVAGSYLFWANVLMYASSSSFDMSLLKNGARIAASAAITSSSTRFDTVSLTAVTELKIGDIVLFKKTSGPTNKVFGHKFSGYGGMLIRRK